jgi:hypothetical protein
VIPGWPGSCSQKWLTRIWVRDQVHDGEKMGGDCYRVPRYPVAPRSAQRGLRHHRIDAGKVDHHLPGDRNQGRGWIDPGPGPCLGRRPQSQRARRQHRFRVDLAESRAPGAGQSVRPAALAGRRHVSAGRLLRVWARASNERGSMQPFAVAWSPKGYVNNAMHRIALTVAA